MDVHFTTAVDEYAAAVLPFLERDPVRCTVPLSVIANASAGLAGPDAVFSWVEAQGDVAGTASVTPPYELLLSVMTDAVAIAVADAWAAHGPPVGGVVGPNDATVRCGERLAELTGRTTTARFAERLFRLDAVTAPPQPTGAPRAAKTADLDLAAGWFDRFITDTGVTRGNDVRRDVAARIADGRLWFWDAEETEDSVSMVATAPTVAKVTRVGPVYTPPDRRGNGYARALTAHVSEQRLSRGDVACCLFTDLANPVSNAIYQQIGYQPVADYAQLGLVATPG